MDLESRDAYWESVAGTRLRIKAPVFCKKLRQLIALGQAEMHAGDFREEISRILKLGLERVRVVDRKNRCVECDTFPYFDKED